MGQRQAGLVEIPRVVLVERAIGRLAHHGGVAVDGDGDRVVGTGLGDLGPVDLVVGVEPVRVVVRVRGAGEGLVVVEGGVTRRRPEGLGRAAVEGVGHVDRRVADDRRAVERPGVTAREAAAADRGGRGVRAGLLVRSARRDARVRAGDRPVHPAALGRDDEGRRIRRGRTDDRHGAARRERVGQVDRHRRVRVGVRDRDAAADEEVRVPDRLVDVDVVIGVGAAAREQVVGQRQAGLVEIPRERAIERARGRLGERDERQDLGGPFLEPVVVREVRAELVVEVDPRFAAWLTVSAVEPAADELGLRHEHAEVAHAAARRVPVVHLDPLVAEREDPRRVAAEGARGRVEPVQGRRVGDEQLEAVQGQEGVVRRLVDVEVELPIRDPARGGDRDGAQEQGLRPRCVLVVLEGPVVRVVALLDVRVVPAALDAQERVEDARPGGPGDRSLLEEDVVDRGG